MFRFVVYILLLGATVSQENFGQKNDVLKARCRAQCLNKFYRPEQNTNCLDDPECWMCWDTCHMFFTNFRVWGHMCGEEKLCFPGCQESCNFHNSQSVALSEKDPSDINVVQPLRYKYLAEKDAVQFEWTRPKENHQTGHLVYVLLIQDELSGGWQQLKQTFYHNATVRRGVLKSSSHIRLMSYDSEGRIAKVEKPCSELNFNLEGENTSGMYKDQRYLDDLIPNYIGHRRGSPLEHWTPSIQSLRDSAKHAGNVDAIVSWTHVSHKAEVRYVVEWRQADQTIDIIGQLSTQNNIGILTLWPNTIYQLTVRAFAPGTRDPIAQSRTLIINTADHSSNLWISRNYMTLMIVAVVVFITATTLCMAQFYCRRRTFGVDAIRKVQPVQSMKKASSFRHTSVKKQLSSLGTRISQGPLNPSVKHDRLIEEDSPFTSDRRHLQTGPCNV